MRHLLDRYPALAPLTRELASAGALLERTVRAGGKMLVCGNGGSAADAEHIVGELMKGFCLPRPLTAKQRQTLTEAFPGEGPALADSLQQAIPAVSLVAGVSLPTAFANDVGAVNVFAQQTLGLGRPGDLLWAISTSGNSPNVLAALRVARAFGLSTLGMTGPGGGRMADLCDVLLAVPGESTAAIQELHLPVYHALCETLEQSLFGQ
ncbi:D-sedoheptulose-7-phosphate isomerase [Solidesulfovibrio magneticus]|uniref:Phosphoheptose isomerase n=1 Tax=Solidesulfovibrio magneticus (strain ATCC 700980 / DSM 13731 / RS-1) TaxID=573370 RepID=C4XUK6_SOLM1|nr:SIS domain-containing protein [Solidesulfovibrio magneticus]BAH73457.1 putative phosphoheptose isomerase [Solidesulfovibrio magneticus RS-1]